VLKVRCPLLAHNDVVTVALVENGHDNHSQSSYFDDAQRGSLSDIFKLYVLMAAISYVDISICHG
jgi:hypothetical protein